MRCKMPSNVIHYYFAKTVKEELNSDIKAIIDNNSQAFLLGAQGPDPLFYLKFEKEPLNQLGEYIHKATDAHLIFQASADYAKSRNSGTIIAFLLGQLCHYAADAVIHPYVYYKEKDMLKFYPANAHENMHVILESAFDYICMRDNMKVNTVFHKSYKNLNIQAAARKEIAVYYSKLIAPMFNIELSPEKVMGAIKLMRVFLRFCDDTTGIKYLFIRALEIIARAPQCVSPFVRPRREKINEDWMNLNRASFAKYHNEPELTNETFAELLLRAEKDAVKLIVNFYDYISKDIALDKQLYYRNYSGELLEQSAKIAE
ncbi:MAG: hypothetical protein EOM87_00345 [Clostridia bacterium]|nr:hypothetical protein [Clostridia bacterium]